MTAFIVFFSIFVAALLLAAVLTLKFTYSRWNSMEHGCVVYVLRPGCESPEFISDYIPARIVNYATAIGETESRWTKAYCADDPTYHLFNFRDVYNMKVITQEQYDCIDEVLAL